MQDTRIRKYQRQFAKYGFASITVSSDDGTQESRCNVLAK